MNDQKLMKRVNVELAKFGRLDFVLADWKKTGGGVKIALAYQSKLGAPTLAQIKEFFELHLPELTPSLETAQRKDNCIILYAGAKSVLRPYSERTKLQPVVANLKFLDQDLGSVWEMSKDEGGKTVLQQVHKFDIEALVGERSRRMGRVTTAKFSVTAIVVNLMPGDTVKFFNNNKSGEGVVRKLNDEKVTLEVPGGEQITISKDCVYKISESNKMKQRQSDEQAESYFSEVFGPTFSRKLVKR